jgi:hypothetical protein
MSLLNRLYLLSLTLATGTSLWAEPLSISVIYPHLTVFNSDPKRKRPLSPTP